MSLREILREMDRENADTHLLDETLDALSGIGRTPENVTAVIVYPDIPSRTEHATGGKRMSWETFAELAGKVVYDNGWGFNHIRQTVIIGEDFVMYRHDYDGSERWKSFDLRADEGIAELYVPLR